MRPSAEDLLARSFQAENERDWTTYRRFPHPEVVWELHAEPERTIRGVEAYLRAIRRAYEGGGAHFSCARMDVSADGTRVAALLVNDAGVRSLDIFDLRDGRIYREYEFILD